MASPPHYLLYNTAVAVSPIFAPSYSQETYADGRITYYKVYKETGLTTLLFEIAYTYTGDDLTQEVHKIYDNGSLMETRTYAITYGGSPPASRTVTRKLQ
jgi:hypothetical protein